jgi:hypothetical protein
MAFDQSTVVPVDAGPDRGAAASGSAGPQRKFAMPIQRETEVIDVDRRQLLSTAALGIAAAGAASLLPAHRARAAMGDAIRPFRISVPEEDLADLRRRIAATR